MFLSIEKGTHDRLKLNNTTLSIVVVVLSRIYCKLRQQEAIAVVKSPFVAKDTLIFLRVCPSSISVTFLLSMWRVNCGFSSRISSSRRNKLDCGLRTLHYTIL